MGWLAHRSGRLSTAALVGVSTLLVTTVGAGAAPHHAPPAGVPSASTARQPALTRQLPAPPPPPVRKPTANPRVVKRTDAPAPLPSLAQLRSTSTVPSAAGSNAAPGASAAQRTLVLYDTTGQWGWLGEAYAVEAANLVSHGSAYVLHPVATYTAGELANYTGAVYVGSTYDEPLPLAFLDDVLSGSRPVLWMNDNIWQLTQRAANFSTQYGWNWVQFDFGNSTTVTYNNVALQRDPLAAPSGLLQTQVVDATRATVLATASGGSGGTMPWAIRGGNLTYVGEIPFSYVGPSDRYFAAADLTSQLANPATPSRKRALVRIEDVGADADPADLRAVADYLYSQRVPFTVAVISQYLDPNGVNNNGVPVSTSLAQAPDVASALRYMRARGGTLLMHGYTHQYSNVANPYDAVSADDFEFYLAHIDDANNVIYDGPVPEDSASWAQNRVNSSKLNFLMAGLPAATIFEPPHYAASAVDYTVFAANFGVRYDRGLYFGGWCPAGACGTGTPNYAEIYGQYFPYLVRDIYGSAVVPEDLGNVEPEPFNNHPPRLPADILASAAAAAVVRDGVQSFFYHPYLGTAYLQQIVTGIKGMGYQFVSAATVAAG
ncbi:DUF2334 domain-containing protein [Solihabitans fulvus]|uniref:DUF2334 domain-containing protein n=1 Tax=Solihabitans fulvus TaxID=1892852 RepID=A0A5B2X6J7_9PSEU|nr:polysaccharide deacetylase family protein [Solihabitans fulvus]KAA2258836.1 DUF2334 domain-containing protein [Solihabitans fulvus]